MKTTLMNFLDRKSVMIQWLNQAEGVLFASLAQYSSAISNVQQKKCLCFISNPKNIYSQLFQENTGKGFFQHRHKIKDSFVNTVSFEIYARHLIFTNNLTGKSKLIRGYPINIPLHGKEIQRAACLSELRRFTFLVIVGVIA